MRSEIPDVPVDIEPGIMIYAEMNSYVAQDPIELTRFINAAGRDMWCLILEGVATTGDYLEEVLAKLHREGKVYLSHEWRQGGHAVIGSIQPKVSWHITLFEEAHSSSKPEADVYKDNPYFGSFS